MKKTALLLFTALYMISCSNVEENNTSSDNSTIESSETNKDYLLTCEGAGKIKLTTTVAEIEELVGKQNLQYDSVFAEGEFVIMQLIAFKDKPEELIFFSQEESTIPYKHISAIKIRQKDSPYSFANGVRTGTAIEDLEELNGGIPISFSGFEWDNEGGFLSFNNGTLSKEMSCFSGRFYHDEILNKENHVIGDGEFKSNQAEVKKIGVYVSEIIIHNGY